MGSLCILAILQIVGMYWGPDEGPMLTSGYLITGR